MTDLDFKTIGLKIKERRQELGITQEQIANSLDVNPSHVRILSVVVQTHLLPHLFESQMFWNAVLITLSVENIPTKSIRIKKKH